MRKYKSEQEAELLQVVCNQCGRELKVENGYLKEDCFAAEKVFGYFSSQDGTRHRFDLCESCYSQMTEGFVIPVEETQNHELL